MTTLPLETYFTSDTTDSNKRDRSEDSSASSSPASKKTMYDGSDEVFVAPDEAPAWALKLFKSLETVSSKMDEKFDQLSLKFDDINSRFNDYKVHVESEIDVFKSDISTKVAAMEKSVTFISDNFDKQLVINTNLEKEIDKLKTELKSANDRNADGIDSLEQYSRRNCVVLHGVPEKEKEDTDQLFINKIQEHLGVEVKVRDIDRSHRLGAKRSDGSGRAIIVKFARYNVRARVFREKRKLKSTGLMLTESLTKKRVAMLNAARDKFGKMNVWSSDGEIMVLKGEQKVNVRNL